MDKKYSDAINFVKEKHEGQFHADKVPVWQHLLRMSFRLNSVLNLYQEGNNETRIDIITSSLGHDLLEDTKTSTEDISKIFGNKGLDLILGMTNTWGDDNTGPYIEKIVSSIEEIRLIKLSDLFDNITSVCYHYPSLGKKWVESFFLPIVIPMKEAVTKTDFKVYPKSAEYYKISIEMSLNILNKLLTENKE